MQVAFNFAGEITQVLCAIPWVRCASGNVFLKHDGNYHERWALLGWKLFLKNYYQKIIIKELLSKNYYSSTACHFWG